MDWMLLRLGDTVNEKALQQAASRRCGGYLSVSFNNAMQAL
jgi:hypothetical protein